VKWSKLLEIFFFFDRNFLSRFRGWNGIRCGILSPKLFEGFFESEGSRGRGESKGVFGPIDVRVHGGQPGFSEEDHVTVAHVHDVEFSEHQSSINLDCKMAVMRDGVFGDLSIGGSDRERGGEAMGFDAMLSDEHPVNECGGCAAVDNSGGLQRFVRVYGGKDGRRDP